MDNEQKKQLIFYGIIAVVIIVLASLYLFKDEIVANFLWLVLLGIFLFVAWKGEFLILLKDYERAVIFRFGKIARVGGPGWTLKIPFIENYKQVDLRVQTIDVPKQDVVTKDNVELKIDAVIYLRIDKKTQSIINSVVEVVDYRRASNTYVVSSIRDLIGSMDLHEVVSNIEKLNVDLKIALENLVAKWGIKIDAVEIKEVELPKVLMDAMHAQKAAVQEKLARMERAEAHKIEIATVKEAAKELDEKALKYYYIKAMEEMSKGKGTKLVFPMEFSKLAETFTGNLNPSNQKSIEQSIAPYKNLLESYVADAVEKAKKKDESKKIRLDDKPKGKKTKN